MAKKRRRVSTQHQSHGNNARATTPTSATPHESEVDAMMASVRQAAGIVSEAPASDAETSADKNAATDSVGKAADDKGATADAVDAEAAANEGAATAADAVDAGAATDEGASAGEGVTTNESASTNKGTATDPHDKGATPEAADDTTASEGATDEAPAQAVAEPAAAPEPASPTPDVIAEAVAESGTKLGPAVAADLALLATVERKLYAHRYAAAELETFGETIDPPKAAADRAEALAVLVEEDHELLSKPEVGVVLERLQAHKDELDPVVARQVHVLMRDRRELVSLSASDRARLVRLQSESYEVWKRSKAQNNWRAFAPYLDRLVSLQRKIAKATNPDADPYDTLLDHYEPGTNRDFYDAFFGHVKRCVVPLLTSITKSGVVLRDDCVKGHFAADRQWELARSIAHLQGIDEQAHYLTSTEHPFSESMTSHYAVTAARVVEDDLMSNVFTMLHETGHNLYEQGVNPAFNHISLKGGTSMGIHESQSRFFENCVGRDRAFCTPLLDLLRQQFPGKMGRVTPMQLYRAINRVEPSLIRMDADEVTYPLHILVRYEIEQLLLSGNATAREVPKLWADRYRKYLGIEVPNDAQGALQDVHWAQGSFGYFPSYALGNAYAAQFRAKMIEEGMNWNGLLAAGNLAPIRAWLRERIWQYGRLKDPAQLILDACGKPFNVHHYVDYLTHKYSDLYSLR